MKPNPVRDFQPCRRLSDNQIVILDLSMFHPGVLSESGSESLICTYSDDETDVKQDVIWSGTPDEPGATHAPMPEKYAASIMYAFFAARAPEPDWALDESVIAVYGDYEFTIMADFPAHVVAEVEIKPVSDPLLTVHHSRISPPESSEHANHPQPH